MSTKKLTCNINSTGLHCDTSSISLFCFWSLKPAYHLGVKIFFSLFQQEVTASQRQACFMIPRDNST